MTRFSPWLLFFIVSLFCIPLFVIINSWTSIDQSIWSHLIGKNWWQGSLFEWSKNTLFLMLSVSIIVMVLGTLLALWVSFYEFPGRRFFEWALMLPLAMPAYVMAFVYLGIFDYSGPIQTFYRSVFGAKAAFFEVRSGLSAAIVFGLVLYPYVYLLARAAFVQQGQNTLQAAQALGLSPAKALFKVAVPIARPAIVAGMALAIMETLADFGAVSIFSFETFTTAIYKSWIDLRSIDTAAQLASLLLMFVLVMLGLEHHSRKHASYKQQQIGTAQLIQSTKTAAWLKTAFCLFIFAIAFLLPLSQLLIWVLGDSIQYFDKRYFSWLFNTLTLGVLGCLLTVLIATFLAWMNQRKTGYKPWIRIANLGYALPSSILAVGVMIFFTYLDRYISNPIQELFGLPVGQWFLGSLFALVLALAIRFSAVAFGPIQSGFESIRPSYGEAATMLGSSNGSIFKKITLPLLRPALLTACLLVMVDVMKEMPATLLMRPFGWDTLAVKIYELTSEGEWERAALPALTLVITGLIPVIILTVQSRRSRYANK